MNSKIIPPKHVNKVDNIISNRPKPERTQIIITERLRTFVVIVIFPAKLYLPKDLIVAM